MTLGRVTYQEIFMLEVNESFNKRKNERNQARMNKQMNRQRERKADTQALGVVLSAVLALHYGRSSCRNLCAGTLQRSRCFCQLPATCFHCITQEQFWVKCSLSSTDNICDILTRLMAVPLKQQISCMF